MLSKQTHQQRQIRHQLDVFLSLNIRQTPCSPLMLVVVSLGLTQRMGPVTLSTVTTMNLVLSEVTN